MTSDTASAEDEILSKKVSAKPIQLTVCSAGEMWIRKCSKKSKKNPRTATSRTNKRESNRPKGACSENSIADSCGSNVVANTVATDIANDDKYMNSMANSIR